MHNPLAYDWNRNTYTASAETFRYYLAAFKRSAHKVPQAFDREHMHTQIFRGLTHHLTKPAAMQALDELAKLLDIIERKLMRPQFAEPLAPIPLELELFAPSAPIEARFVEMQVERVNEDPPPLVISLSAFKHFPLAMYLVLFYDARHPKTNELLHPESLALIESDFPQYADKQGLYGL